MDRTITSSPEVVLILANNSNSNSSQSSISSPCSPPPPSFSPPPPPPPNTSPPASPHFETLPLHLLLQPCQQWHQAQVRRSLQLSFNSFNLDRIDEALDQPSAESPSHWDTVDGPLCRKRSLESDLLPLYSYYNKYFDCSMLSHGQHRRRRYSAPSRTVFTSMDESIILRKTPVIIESKSPTQSWRQRPNRLMFSLDVNNYDENDPFTTKNIEKHNQRSVNQENVNNNCQEIRVLNVCHQIKRNPKLDLCFTPSQEQVNDCLMKSSCEKLCHKCANHQHI